MDDLRWTEYEDTESNKKIYKSLKKCLDLREKYMDYLNKDLNVKLNFEINGGEIYLFTNDKSIKIPTLMEYMNDVKHILHCCYDGPTKSLSFRRLENLRHNFLMYKNLSTEKEKLEQKSQSRVDFYKVIKVDTHIHHSACMNSKHLLKFMKKKLINSENEIVYKKQDKSYTLKDIFQKLKITENELRIDNLDTHAHVDTFQRFDRFNSKYNPLGQPILREIFLKYDNYLNGKYLAQITHETLQGINENKYVFVEYRISIYGKSMEEWNKLSGWFCKYKLYSPKIRWIIQIPRLYKVWKVNKHVNSFAEFLENIFKPLMKISEDPESDKNLSTFLKNVVGFDCVDDESVKEKHYRRVLVSPSEWNLDEEPPYFYYLFYFYKNIACLNSYRVSKGLNTFSFVPHSGETGDWEHLVHSFLLSNSICHGVQLRKSLPLQYLYYLAQIGISMSPLSNNSLFIRIDKNPFYDFFSKGLKVTLSTDDPLQFHFTKEPLMEEYSVASQIWKLSSCDQCEIARNSVIISNFPNKKQWIGNYDKPGVEGNDIKKTNVANLRIEYRYKTWLNEISNLK